jgi:hypothetical protein
MPTEIKSVKILDLSETNPPRAHIKVTLDDKTSYKVSLYLNGHIK